MNQVKLKIVENKPIKIIFCLPGPNYSGDFLSNWSELLLECTRNNIIPMLSQKYDPVVYYVRNKCLGGDVMRGIKQKPYNGKIDYDFLMWIDSDIIFSFGHFIQLLRYNRNIVSGIYKVKGGMNYATVLDWDREFFLKNGYFQFLTPDDLKGKKDLIDVAYTGFGFILIKKGVFESLEYPWFRPIFQKMSDTVRDFSSEDVSFCRLIREKGYKIYIDPTIVVGHEKTVVF